MKPIRKENKDNKAESFDETGTIVVGIGASAGGLEALQIFQKPSPVKQRRLCCYPALSPDYKSLMDELLARQTPPADSIMRMAYRDNPKHLPDSSPQKSRIFKEQTLFSKSRT